MQNIIKSILLWGIILIVCQGLCGCKGGKIPEIGGINGPDTIDEYENVEFWVSLTNASDATFLWSCDPVDAGKFDDPDLPKTGFTASMVTHDTPVKISVMVDSLQSSPVLLSKNITVRDVTKLSVGEIEGPDIVEEGSSVTYSIAAADDTGITYQWSAVPDTLGMFDTPDQPLTQFTAHYLDEDTPLEIQVIVDSDNYGPILKKKTVAIKDMGPYGWARTWGGSFSDWPGGVAIDGSGNIYVTGGFHDIVDFDPGTGVDEYTSNGDYDIFLAKFDSSGGLQWTRTWGGIGWDFGTGVAVDETGNAYVIGCFKDTVDLDPGPGVDERTSRGETDIFLCKFNSSGEVKWARTWGSYSSDISNGIAIDGSGNACVTGRFRYIVDFDPGQGVDNHKSNGKFDIFLSKFDSSGNFQWARTWGGDDWDYGGGVTVDGNGNAYVTGYFYFTVDFNPGPEVEEHTSNGESDIFLSKFDSNGDFQWVRTCGGSYADSSNGVAVDENGNTYITGSFRDTVDLDPGLGVDERSSNGDSDMFLCKFDSEGDFQLACTWGGSFTDWLAEVVVDDSGNTYVIGGFQDIVDFDPGSGVDEHASNGYDDIFLSKFDSNGNFQWAQTWGGEDVDSGCGVAVDGIGNAYVTGRFSLTVDFDPGPGVDKHTFNGYEDIFLSRFPPDGNW